MIAAIVIVIGVFGGGDEEAPIPDVIDGSSRTPLETVELWIERYEGGDVDGYQALMSPDAVYRCFNCGTISEDPDPYFGGRNDTATSDARESLQFYVTGASWGASCSAQADVVSCSADQTGGAFAVVSDSGELASTSIEFTFTVSDGLITEWVFENTGVSGITFDTTREADYLGWLAETHPDDHAELVLFGTMLLNDDAQVERHRELVAEWAGALRAP